MADPDYAYGGQWFDDMGALAFSFRDAPITGVDIARSGLTRDQSNDMAVKLMNTGISPYEQEGTIDLGV